MRLYLQTEVDTLLRDFLGEPELKVIENQLSKEEDSCGTHGHRLLVAGAPGS